LTLGVKKYFYRVKKFKKTHTTSNNLLMTIELEEKTKKPQIRGLNLTHIRVKG
jgi:hypothetical protein